MEKYTADALQILDELPENEYKESLRTMVNYVMEREKWSFFNNIENRK